MKIFKAIIYAILLIIWLLFTIIFTFSVIPMVLIVICGLNEWFNFYENIINKFNNL